MKTPDFSIIKPSPLYKSQPLLQLKAEIAKRKNMGVPIILVTGVFDGLHSEHKNFLKKAKDQKGMLIVAIESDVRVRQLKGEGRPQNHQSKRLQEILLFPSVDAGFILPEDFSSPTRFEEVIWELSPDVLAVSSHTNHLEYKNKVMQKYGGKVQIVHEHNPTISTTKLLTQKTQSSS